LRGPAPPLFDGYRALAALPTHPNALRRWAYERARNTTGGGMHDDGDVFLFFNHMLRGNVLPPKLEAAIFRVLKQLPGVTVLDTVDVLGRPAIALGLGTSAGSMRSCCWTRRRTRTEGNGRPSSGMPRSTRSRPGTRPVR
jgi:hypothetical protein